MQNKYICVKQENNGEYVSYGIVLEGNEEVCVWDISSSREFVAQLTDILNQYQVAPEHLLDVVEDAVISRSMD